MRGEVDLRYVQTDRHVVDIYTKALGSNKLQHFSEMLGLQHLGVLHLRGRTSREEGGEQEEKVKQDAESIEEVDTSDKVRTSDKGDNVRKNKADKKKEEARTKTWSDVVQGLKMDEKSETTDSIEWFDSDEPNRMKASK